MDHTYWQLTVGLRGTAIAYWLLTCLVTENPEGSALETIEEMAAWMGAYRRMVQKKWPIRPFHGVTDSLGTAAKVGAGFLAGLLGTADASTSRLARADEIQ